MADVFHVEISCDGVWQSGLAYGQLCMQYHGRVSRQLLKSQRGYSSKSLRTIFKVKTLSRERASQSDIDPGLRDCC